MKKHLFFSLFLVGFLACKKSGSNTEEPPTEQTTDEWNAVTGGKPFSAILNGSQEVPGPGDAAGKGTFEMALNPGKKSIAYRLTVSSISKATAAHIYEGKAGESGPVRVTLKAPVSGNLVDTLYELDKTLVLEMMKNPENYYVNILNEPFPKGAIRGQITK